MFRKAPPPPFYRRMIEEELERAIACLKTALTDSEEYVKMLATVEKLHALLDEKPPSNTVSKDTLAVVGANLLGILMVIKHEHVNVITSRAMNMVLKPRS